MSNIRIVPLGAGQDVGRSCILATVGSKTIMFDCGMHMGYSDARRFPNFDFIAPKGQPMTDKIDCVIISHFHLDHCGSLPYFSEVRQYNGPIVMTHPTRAICPILLEDYRKITVDRQGVTDFFNSEQIQKCMNKVTCVNLHETLKFDDIEIQAFYAGHVLGAAMFLVKSCGQSVLYTGDFNATPDRHLGGMRIPQGLTPDVLITESTYATTVRDSKRLRERDLLKQIHECIERGGKVLIPVFALGRAQELLILVEAYWERMNLKVPVYFTTGLAARANEYYKSFILWTNQKVKETFIRRNLFDFKKIQTFDRTYLSKPGPMVVFASPGMLHAGMSLEIFKNWCGDPANRVILPGYCVQGTVGNKILAGRKVVEIDHSQVAVRCAVSKVSFSAHADAKGIMLLLRQSRPRNVVLVHGEARKMYVLKARIERDLQIPCYTPDNGTTISITPRNGIPVFVSDELLTDALRNRSWDARGTEREREAGDGDDVPIFEHNDFNLNNAAIFEQSAVPVQGLLVYDSVGQLRLETLEKGIEMLGKKIHKIRHGTQCSSINGGLQRVFEALQLEFPNEAPTTRDEIIYLRSVQIEHKEQVFIISWDKQEEEFGEKISETVANLNERKGLSVLTFENNNT